MSERWLSRARQEPWATLQIALLFAVGVGLRFVNLGYSNFQGDEISAICRPTHLQSLVKFLGYLLAQRKGPVQYVISCAYGLLDPAFSSELALRLPYAIASTLSLLCFFIIAWYLFGRGAAIAAGFLLATNGVFVGQARFAQYQSMVQLGVTAGILGILLGVRNEAWRVRGLYLGAVAAAGALLAHFDGAWAVLPMGVLVIHWWADNRRHPDFRRLRLHLLAAGGIFAALVLAFYLEYAMRLSAYQLDYWSQRFGGSGTNSLHFFQYFNPGPILWIYLAGILLALLRLRWTTAWQVTLAWLVPPLIFVELAFRDSRASAYSYFLPLALVAGVGLDFGAHWLARRLKRPWATTPRTGLVMIFLAMASITSGLIVDHHPEYPWQSKNVLGLEVPGGDFNGMFGMPYNRDWRAIGDWFARQSGSNLVVSTNEKLAIAQFYLPNTVRLKYIWRDAPKEVPDAGRVYFVMIRRPQSWVDQLWGRTFEQWHAKFTPAADFTNDSGELVASVYLISMDQYRSASEN